jgi:hypothetical protein
MPSRTLNEHLAVLDMQRRLLLFCGVAAVLLYVAADVIGALGFPGYVYTDQTISELVAIDAPSRPLLVPLSVVYAALWIAFGIGIWRSAGRSRALRVVAVGLATKEVLGAAVVLFFPMHLRAALAAGGSNYSDTGHIVLTVIGVFSFLIAIGFGSTVFGNGFRLYSAATVGVLIVFATLTFMLAPQMSADLPTPWMGAYERVNAFGYELWAAVLAIRLLRRGETAEPQATSAAETGKSAHRHLAHV